MFEFIVLSVATAWLLFVAAQMDPHHLSRFSALRVTPLILGVLMGVLVLKGFGVL